MCFDLARDLSVHVRAQSSHREWIVGEHAPGLLVLGDVVTFEAVHFGIRQKLTSKIIAMRIPDEFIDEMQRGAFKSMRHTHSFEDASGGTLMRDKLEFEAPLGILGQDRRSRLLESLYAKLPDPAPATFEADR